MEQDSHHKVSRVLPLVFLQVASHKVVMQLQLARTLDVHSKEFLPSLLVLMLVDLPREVQPLPLEMLREEAINRRKRLQ